MSLVNLEFESIINNINTMDQEVEKIRKEIKIESDKIKKFLFEKIDAGENIDSILELYSKIPNSNCKYEVYKKITEKYNF